MPAGIRPPRPPGRNQGLSEKELTDDLSFVNPNPPDFAYNSHMTTELAPDLDTCCRSPLPMPHHFSCEQHIDICLCSPSPCTGRGLGGGVERSQLPGGMTHVFFCRIPATHLPISATTCDPLAGKKSINGDGNPHPGFPAAIRQQDTPKRQEHATLLPEKNSSMAAADNV